MVLTPLVGAVLHAVNYSRLGLPHRWRLALFSNLITATLVFWTAIRDAGSPGLRWIVAILLAAYFYKTRRLALLEPRLGERTAHQIGTIIVVAAFALVIWATAGWVVPGLDRGRLIALGIGWTVAKVLFEFGFGHWIAGHSWSRLLTDYDLAAGRLWVLVLLTLLVGPVVAGTTRSSPGG